jgi:hypothetical protein
MLLIYLFRNVFWVCHGHGGSWPGYLALSDNIPERIVNV